MRPSVTRAVTLEDVLQLQAALLAYGWGACEIVALDTHLHSIKVSFFVKTPEQVDMLVDALTKSLVRV